MACELCSLKADLPCFDLSILDGVDVDAGEGAFGLHSDVFAALDFDNLEPLA